MVAHRGISRVRDRGAIVPASAIIAALGALSAYTFCLIGRLCSQSKAESYEQAWARTVGEKSAWLPAGSCVATCFAGCLAYTIIIGDSFSALAKAFGAPPVVASRSNIILALSATVLLPLSLLKSEARPYWRRCGLPLTLTRTFSPKSFCRGRAVQTMLAMFMPTLRDRSDVEPSSLHFFGDICMLACQQFVVVVRNGSSTGSQAFGHVVF